MPLDVSSAVADTPWDESIDVSHERRIHRAIREPPLSDADADGLVLRFLLEADGRKDPYPLYRELRETAPVHRSGLGPVFLSRHADCQLVLRDPRCGKPDPDFEAAFPPPPGMFGQRRPSMEVGEDGEAVPALGRSMLTLNPPDHTRVRGLVSRAFTPRRVAGLEPAIARMLDELLDPLAEAGEAEIIGDLAFRLPVAVIGELVGVPEGDRDQFRDLVRSASALVEPIATDDMIATAQESAGEMVAYFEELIARRRAEPRDDLLSALIAARDGQDRLSEVELLSTVIIIFLAGFETTTNLIGNGLHALLTHPDALEALRSDPSLDETAVDELLRWDSPVQLDLRVAFEDVELPGGEVLEAGTQIVTLLGAANHDPAAFAAPDRLDLARHDAPILSFAVGPHYCLGASLARAEGRIVLRGLLDRFPTIELLDDDPPRRAGFTLRGYDRLPVSLAG